MPHQSFTKSKAAKNTSDHFTHCHCQKRSPTSSPMMKLLHFLTALLTFLKLSPPTIQSLTTDTDPNISTDHVPVRRWPTRATIQSHKQSLTTKTDSKASTCHVPIRRWPTRVMVQARMHGARPDDVSLSPPALPDSPTSALNNTTKHNNPTSPSPQTLPQPPTWALTLEDLVTAIYRIVSIVLTLFNINITWRFHGKCHSSWRTRTSTTLTCPLANHGHQPREARRAWAGVRFV